jgi:hypothetical protein
VIDHVTLLSPATIEGRVAKDNFTAIVGRTISSGFSVFASGWVSRSADIADRKTGKGVVIVPTGTNAFRAAVADPNVTGPNDVSGPNGVLTVHHTEAWIGDAPSFSSPIVKNATVSVAYAGADEMAWDLRDEIFLVANPGEHDVGKANTPTAPFVTLISTWPVAAGKTHPILAKIAFDGTNGTPNATNGIVVPVPSTSAAVMTLCGTTNGCIAAFGPTGTDDPGEWGPPADRGAAHSSIGRERRWAIKPRRPGERATNRPYGDGRRWQSPGGRPHSKSFLLVPNAIFPFSRRYPT